MKRFCLLTLSLILFAACQTPQTDLEEAADLGKGTLGEVGEGSYTNIELGFSMEYPTDWLFDESFFESPSSSSLDLHLNNNVPTTDAPVCEEGFIGMEIQLHENAIPRTTDFETFVRENLYSLEPSLGVLGGELEFSQLNGREMAKADSSGWEGCDGPGYVVEVSDSSYLYIFTGYNEGTEGALEAVNQILNSFSFKKTYQNNELGYSFKYPDAWTLDLSGLENSVSKEVTVVPTDAESNVTYYSISIEDRDWDFVKREVFNGAEEETYLGSYTAVCMTEAEFKQCAVKVEETIYRIQTHYREPYATEVNEIEWSLQFLDR